MAALSSRSAAREAIADRTLDVALAEEVMGFRWVVWNGAALGHAPLYTPGRILAAADDPLSHFHLPATPDAPLAEGSIDRVPRYCEEVEEAFRAAEAAGLFSEGRATLAQDPSGAWRVGIPGMEPSVLAADLAHAVCQATLRWARERQE